MTHESSRRLKILAIALGLTLAAPAGAVVPMLDGYGGPYDWGFNCLSHNDDGSSARIELGPFFSSGLQFFTSTHTSVYVNTNGNITFSGALPTYTPDAFPVASRPMIAPYWADVDIRNMFPGGSCVGGAGTSERGDLPCESPPENGVWWHLAPGLMVVTWDRVGYYSCHVNYRMSFQLVLTEVPGCSGAGDFDVEFRFNRCEWTTGDASGGSGGFGGTPAQAGFDAGNSVDFVEVPGSRSSTIHTIMCNDSNVGVPGLWQYQIRSGMVLCPEAGDPCDTGLLGVCADGITECVDDLVVCTQILEPSEEICDNLDNDCDGEVDEGEGLCLEWEVCDRGVCIERCSEFGCPPGHVCGDDDLCVDADCIGVECPPGERCVDGICVEPCDGVVCPCGRQCRAGRCLDLCDYLSCDECTVCEAGECVLRCEYEDCPGGYDCMTDGSCVESTCVGITCALGEVCSAGSCIDGCIGAACPAGEVCELCECIPAEDPVPDPRPDPPPDADTAPDAPASDVVSDTVDDAGGDPPITPPWGDRDSGCGCSIIS
ncbi:MAG: hypothetical protein JRG91_12775 [Deltaproteobacteria bacterium]|nr:hypothetical protein [Deltaproteobacteria bacterium]